jgi:hypothetical protein
MRCSRINIVAVQHRGRHRNSFIRQRCALALCGHRQLRGAIQYPGDSHDELRGRGVLDHPRSLPRTMTAELSLLFALSDTRFHSRCALRARVMLICYPQKEEGAGKVGCLANTHGPRAGRSARGRNHRHGRCIPAFPARCFTAYTRSPRGPAFLPPSPHVMLSIIARLGVSSGTPGPHDFTVRKSAFVRMAETTLRALASIASRAQRS